VGVVTAPVAPEALVVVTPLAPEPLTPLPAAPVPAAPVPVAPDVARVVVLVDRGSVGPASSPPHAAPRVARATSRHAVRARVCTRPGYSV
jgi:hypothetical protein